MSDDLVKRLREPWFTNGCELYQLEAADAIEQLTAERDAAYVRKSALGQKNDFLRFQYAVAVNRIEALTADFARQVQRTDEQREAYKQALSVMEAERDRLIRAGDLLSVCAQTTGGTAGRDNGLVDAIQGWGDARAALNGETT
jgi:hypothetical protein